MLSENYFYIILLVIFCILYFSNTFEKLENTCNPPKETIQGIGNAYTGLMCINDDLPLISLSDSGTFNCISKFNANDKDKVECLTRKDLGIPSSIQCRDPNVSKFQTWKPETSYKVNDTVYYAFEDHVKDITDKINKKQEKINNKIADLKNKKEIEQLQLQKLQLKLSKKEFDPLTPDDLVIVESFTKQINTLTKSISDARSELATENKKKPKNTTKMTDLTKSFNKLVKDQAEISRQRSQITPITRLNKKIDDTTKKIQDLENRITKDDTDDKNDIDELKIKLTQIPTPNNFICITEHVSGKSFDESLWKISKNVNAWLSSDGLRDVNGPSRLIFDQLSKDGYNKQECNFKALNDPNHWCNKVYNSYQSYCKLNQKDNKLSNNSIAGCDAFDFQSKTSTPGTLSKYYSTTTNDTVTNTFFGTLPQTIIDINTNNGTPDASTVNKCSRECTIDSSIKDKDLCNANCLCCGLKANCPSSALNSNSGCCMQAKLLQSKKSP
jgi:hypothetical protein